MKRLTDTQFLLLLQLTMASDPWPLEKESTHDILTDLLDKEAEARGFDDWIQAYHEFEIDPNIPDNVVLSIPKDKLEKLIKQAEQKSVCEIYPEGEFDPSDGRNYNDTFYRGMEDGAIHQARGVLEAAGIPYKIPEKEF